MKISIFDKKKFKKMFACIIPIFGHPNPGFENPEPDPDSLEMPYPDLDSMKTGREIAGFFIVMFALAIQGSNRSARPRPHLESEHCLKCCLFV
jgi:hypothetical protein